MQRYALWRPYEVRNSADLLSYSILYGVCCAACGRTLAYSAVRYEGGKLQADCSLNPDWHRNDVGMYRRSKRTQRRKFGYSLPDGETMYAHLQSYIQDDLMPFVIECDGKMLLDERYVPCKERNIVDPFAADNVLVREELVSA